MADAKITALTAISSVAADDIVPVVDDVAGTPATTKATFTQIAALFQTIWTSLQFGGATSSFPMLKRSTTFLETKLADDSAYAIHRVRKLGLAGATGLTTLELQFYQATVTVANGQTTGKESGIGIPANFMPIFLIPNVTVAATNAVNLLDVGDDADTDSFVDGASIAVNATGIKSALACNGVRGNPGGTTNTGGALVTADEIEIVVSGDPGATGVTIVFTIVGWAYAA